MYAQKQLGRDLMKYSIGIVSFDRSPTDNYIIPTLDSLSQDFDSPLLHDVTIYDSGSPAGHLASLEEYTQDQPKVHLSIPENRLYIQENGARCLLESAEQGAELVIFIEDDIEVCSNFLQKVDDWLNKNYRDDVYAYTMGAAYPDNLRAAAQMGQDYWEYPIEAFYGIQCFIMKSKYAKLFGEYLAKAPGGQYNDMHLKDWLASLDQRILLTPAPYSFIQHIGFVSNYHKGRYHDFPFIGR
jgi:hypothetical protein